MLTLKIAEHFVKKLNSLHKYMEFVFQTSIRIFCWENLVFGKA